MIYVSDSTKIVYKWFSSVTEPDISTGDTILFDDPNYPTAGTDTVIISGSYGPAITHLISAEAKEGYGVASTDTDSDDTLILHFSEKVTFDLNSSNINNILVLSANHSFLDGILSIPEAEFSADSLSLRITFGDQIHFPTLRASDTLFFTDANYPVISPDTILISGSFETDRIEQLKSLKFSYEGFAPNPFNPSTILSFSLKKSSDYKVTIFSAVGKEKMSLDGLGVSGPNTVTVNMRNFNSGVYLAHVKIGSKSYRNKIILLK